MKQILAKAGLLLLAFSVPAIASAEPTIEGRWTNLHHTVIVNVTRCGEAYCGTVSWATAKNRARGDTPGTRVLTDLRHQGDGVYRGDAYDPKRDMRGSATVHQVAPDVMMVKGCAVFGLVCREQRWTRVS
jgi:uncharacterized protein (DUF2147 family)